MKQEKKSGKEILFILGIVFLTMGQMQGMYEFDSDLIYFGTEENNRWTNFGYTNDFNELENLTFTGSLYWFSENNHGVMRSWT